MSAGDRIVSADMIAVRSSSYPVTARFLTDRFDGRGKNISRATFGADELRPRLPRFDFFPQPADLNVDRPVVYLIVVEPRRVEQLLA